MMNGKILGIVLLVVGLVLLLFGWQSSQGMDDQIAETFTGRFTDSTIWFLVLGAASAVAGAGLLLFSGSTKN